MPYIPIEHFQETDADHSTSRIRDMPYGKARESLVIFPTEVKFAETKSGELSPPYPIVITNNGYDIVVISDIKIVGDFILSGDLDSILPGEHASISVSFAPKRTGPVTGGVYLNSGSASGEEFIHLSGSGVEHDANYAPRTLRSIDYPGTTISDRINAAISASITGDTINANEGGFHLVTSTITILDKGITLDLGVTHLEMIADQKIIYATCTPAGPWKLTSDYNYTTSPFTLNVATMDRIPKAGEWFMIYSEAIDPANRDRGTNASQYRVGEKFQCGEGCTVNLITMKRPLRFTRGVEFDGATKIDSFTLLKNARVLRYQELPLVIRGGTMAYEAGHANVWLSSGVDIRGWVNPRLQNIKFLRGFASAFNVGGCIHGQFLDLVARNQLPNNGYGITLGGDTRSVVRGLIGYMNRHTTTDNSLTRGIGTSTKELILMTGRSVGTLVEGCASYNAQSSAFDTHHGATDWTFRDNYVDGSDTWALSLRGQNNKIDGLIGRNCGYGIQIFTEYHSGDVGDEYFVSGKPEGIGSGSLANVDIECTIRALSLSHVRAVISGYNRLVTDNCQAIYNDGSQVDIYGTIDHKCSGKKVSAQTNDSKNVAIIFLDPQSDLLQGDFPTTTIFHRNSVFKSDTTLAYSTGTSYMFYTSNECYIDMRGTMEFIVGDAISDMYYVAGGSTATILWGDTHHMTLSGPGLSTLDQARSGWQPGHYDTNPKSHISDYRARVPDLVDDVTAYVNCSLLTGRMDIMAHDFRGATNTGPVSCSFHFLDPTISSSENCAITVPDPNGIFVAVQNADLTTLNVPDGKIGITYKDGQIQILPRLGWTPLTFFLRGWGTRDVGNVA